MGLDKLLSPTEAGDLSLKHRVVMSAMTRLRNDPETELPREINVTYYSQRTSEGGLIISEGKEFGCVFPNGLLCRMLKSAAVDQSCVRVGYQHFSELVS